MGKKFDIVLFLCLIVSGLSLSAFSNNLVALRKEVKAAKTPKDKVDALVKLSYEFRYQDSDSSEVIAWQALKISKDYVYKKGEAESIYLLSKASYYRSEYKASIGLANTAKDVYEQINDSVGIGNCYMSIGDCYFSLDKYNLSLKNYFKALDYFKAVNNVLGKANIYLSLGDIYYSQENYTDAMTNFRKAFAYYDEADSELGKANAINCVADILFEQRDYESAKEKYYVAISMFKEIGDNLGLANCTKRLGDIYFEREDYESAQSKYIAAYNSYDKIGSVTGIASCIRSIAEVNIKKRNFLIAEEKLKESEEMFNRTGDIMGLAGNYITFSKLHKELNDIDKAIDYSLKAYQIGKENHIPMNMLNASQLLSELYQLKNNFKDAYRFEKIYNSLGDSLSTGENIKKLTQLQMQFEYENKRKEEILLQEKKDLEFEMQIEQERIQKIFLIVGVILLVILTASVYRGYSIKKRGNKILEEKNSIIESKNKEITDSIRYAKNIQEAILSSDEYLKKLFQKQFFVFYKPRDIIGGDFYWAYKTPLGEILWCVGDCTGHGVPGAMMSMMGISLLNDVVIEGKHYETDIILNELKAGVINGLKQNLDNTDSRDGMDIAICKLSADRKTLSFSGAYNSVAIVNADGLKEIKGDKQPIGISSEYELPFTKHEVIVTKGEMIYLTSDGFTDQFGGEKGKKYSQARYKKLIQAIAFEDMESQKNKLVSEHMEWRERHKQLDDICVLGIRV